MGGKRVRDILVDEPIPTQDELQDQLQILGFEDSAIREIFEPTSHP